MSTGSNKIVICPERNFAWTDRDLRRASQTPRSHADVYAERRNRAVRYKARLRLTPADIAYLRLCAAVYCAGIKIWQERMDQMLAAYDTRTRT